MNLKSLRSDHKLIAATYSGIEDVVEKEVKGKKIGSGRVTFTSEYIDKIRSINFVHIMLKEFKFKSLDDILKKSKTINFSFIQKDFVVRCKRLGVHDFGSLDVEKSLGELIYEKGFKVKLDSKNVIIVDIVKDHCFIGVLLKDNMCRREYMLRINKRGINACMAYSLLKIVGWNKKDSLYDPNCKDGVILIEACLSGGKKVYGYDKNEFNLRSAEINSKLAKVKINFSKVDKVDYVVSSLPSESKRIRKSLVKKIYAGFFGEVKKIVKKRILITVLDDKLLKEYLTNFRIIEKREIIAGNKYQVYVLEQS